MIGLFCLERVVALYTLNTNDQQAKCYVACMMVRFNVVSLIIVNI